MAEAKDDKQVEPDENMVRMGVADCPVEKLVVNQPDKQEHQRQSEHEDEVDRVHKVARVLKRLKDHKKKGRKEEICG